MPEGVRPLVVIPTYQEAENIATVLQRVRTALPVASILVVDDGSPDGTADLAEAVASEVGQVEVLRRPSKAGLGSAYRAGFAHGIARGFDVLIEMDADLSHDPSDLPRLVRILCDANYQGYVALEYEAAEDPKTAIPRYARILRDMCN